MTWKTSQGDRVLTKQEAKLFCQCITVMIEMADDCSYCKKLNFGHPLIEGRLVSLLLNSMAITKSCPHPLYAVNLILLCYFADVFKLAVFGQFWLFAISFPCRSCWC